jgi:hypothetical protein
MRTDELVTHLSRGLTPVGRDGARRRLRRTLIVGALIALAMLGLTLGFRSDLSSAVLRGAFWMKLGFILWVGLGAYLAVEQVAKPEGRIGWVWAVILLPVAACALAGAVQLANAQHDQRLAIWLGHSAAHAPFRILAFATPIYAALVIAFHRFAPTNYRKAGFVIGLLSGSAGGAVYSLFCREMAPAFLATWYVLGVLLTAVIGALIGPRFLRW